MKIVAFNGSPRKDGNTAILLNLMLDELKKEGFETELIQLAGETLAGCIACYKCAENKDQKCAVVKDRVNECIAKMHQAQGILLGSPTYIWTSGPIYKIRAVLAIRIIFVIFFFIFYLKWFFVSLLGMLIAVIIFFCYSRRSKDINLISIVIFLRTLIPALSF